MKCTITMFAGIVKWNFRSTTDTTKELRVWDAEVECSDIKKYVEVMNDSDETIGTIDVLVSNF